MKAFRRTAITMFLLLPFVTQAQKTEPKVDWDAVAKIREEGLQRSQVMDIAGYLTDVLASRLSLSDHMKKAQAWAKEKMIAIGLTNVAVEPFMDYGASWDNEYFSLHMLEPTYQPMVGFPLAYTPGTQGRLQCFAVIVDVQTKSDCEKYRGKLKNSAVLISPLVAIDLNNLPKAVSRFTEADLKNLEGMAAQNATRSTFRCPQSRITQTRRADRISQVRRCCRCSSVRRRNVWNCSWVYQARCECRQMGSRQGPGFLAHDRSNAGALQPNVPNPETRHPRQARDRGSKQDRRVRGKSM